MSETEQILVKEKEVVVPGDALAQGMGYLPGQWTYRKDEKIIASRLGIAHIDGRTIKIIPLSGRYAPKTNDVIICNVIDVGFSGWRLETNSAYSAMMSLKEATSDFINRGADLTQYFDVGDYVLVKIINVTSQKLIDVTAKGPGLRKLKGGRIIEVNTNKVPRIIGKQGSMVTMIKEMTGCKITVGQNGLIWISGEPEKELLAVKTIKMIEKQSHLSGLTDMVKGYLESNGEK